MTASPIPLEPSGERVGVRTSHPLLHILAWIITIVAAATVAFAWLFPDMGDVGRWIEPLNWFAFCGRTFGYHIGIALLLPMLLMLLRRMWRPAMLGGVVAIWCLWPSIWSLRPRGEPPPLGSPTLSVYSVNAQFDVVDPARLLVEITSLNADLVIIQEHNPRVQSILPQLRGTYPHVIEAMRDDAFGMAILSKFPFVGTPQHYPDFGMVLLLPQVRTVVDVDGTQIVVQGIHALPPVSLAYLRDQRRLIRAVARWSTLEKRPLIIAGDFNCTPEAMSMGWMRDAGLSDAWMQRRSGRGTTWPMDAGLLSLMGVKIDHLFLGNGLVALEAQTGQAIGSDHRSLFARVTKTP